MSLPKEEAKRVLRLIENDLVFWQRGGSSKSYNENLGALKELIRGGYAIPVPDGCCRKEYLLTDAGAQLLKS